MTSPPIVARSAQRIALGGAVAAMAIWVAAVVVERTQLGADLGASRARLRAEVSGQFAALGNRLDTAVRAVTLDAETVRLAEQGDATATRRLFDQAGGGSPTSSEPVAITIYGGRNQPVAWVGRSEDVSPARLNGPASLFVAQSTQGLRLVRVQPVANPADPAQHIGAVVAEAPLSRDARAPIAGSDFALETSIVPVSLRLQFEGAADAGADSFIIRTPSGEALAAVELSDADLEGARQRIHDRLFAAEIALGAVLLLLFVAPLLDWRRAVRAPRTAAALTLGIALLLVAARATLWVATRRVGLAEPSLTASGPWSPLAAVFLASPLDLLLTSMLAAGLTALGVSTYSLWRSGHRPGLGTIVVNRPTMRALFLATQFAGGLASVALLIAYGSFLRTHVSQASVDILRFDIDTSDGTRLMIAAGMFALNAAVIGVAVTLLRLALSPWVFHGSSASWHARAVVVWLLPALMLLWPGMAEDHAPPAPILTAIVVVAAAAWMMHRYGPGISRGSQASRLLLSLLALVLPSVVLYPSLVDASARARRQVVAERYAPEVLNQRQDVHAKLTQALTEIDRIEAIEDLVRASEPAPPGPPPIDAAFRVWSQTSLASQRLTSSVELHNTAGAMVSRFAMNLPDAQGQTWQESSCDWETLEEVSPFYSEDRRLLHAGKAICTPAVNGQRSFAGSVVVHSMLDYANLSFISAQNPYTALMRSGQPRPEPRARAEVELYVYGWSRRVLYSSVESPPPLTEAVFRRAYESRTPFWTTIVRGDASFDAYVMSDRAGIYVLGTSDPTAFGHLVTLAELVALAFAAFVAIIVTGMIVNLVLSRAPASGRALLAEVRASFYRKLFLAFVLSAIVPVLALAFVSRVYIASLMFADIESQATRLANVASRVVEDVGALQISQAVVDDNLVWLSRVIAQDVNIFEGPNLLASSERNLFASGLLPTRTPGEVFRAIVLEGRPSFVGRERTGGLEYLTAATPVRIEGGREAILTVPLTSRQQETEAQIEELDRRVLLAALLFIMVGAGIGYYMAERIADPVNRLMRATRRIARGDLDARVLATSSDELRRLVEAFNQMAADLRRQRQELERTNRLAAWADMARQVAHDIKNPLTPIQLNAEHLRRVHIDQGRPLGGVIDECVSNILGQVRLLRQISSEFSSFASSPEPRPVETSLFDLVTEVVEPYRSGLLGRVAIESHVPPGLPVLRIDRMLVGRALTNVIENALHAMPAGGTLTIDAALAPGRMVQLRVTDTGVGMDAEALAKIFEPYFSTKATGTGLGLTIAKRNTEANGGEISVTSERGHGTSVTMTLPQA